MRRFFIDPADITESTAVINGEEFNHIKNALRLKAGEDCVLLDGSGYEYIAKINAVDSDCIRFDIREKHYSLSEPKTRVTLYQGMPKSMKLDTVVQKCTELGAVGIVPFFSARCVKIPDKGFDKKTERLSRIAKEAVKQSKRAVIPVVAKPIDLNQLLKDIGRHELAIVCYEDELETSLKQELKKSDANDIALIIGPEGGFAPEEIDLLKTAGAKAVSLGKRILRTETAGMAGLAMILYERELG